MLFSPSLAQDRAVIAPEARAYPAQLASQDRASTWPDLPGRSSGRTLKAVEIGAASSTAAACGNECWAQSSNDVGKPARWLRQLFSSPPGMESGACHPGHEGAGGSHFSRCTRTCTKSDLMSTHPRACRLFQRLDRSPARVLRVYDLSGLTPWIHLIEGKPGTVLSR